MTTPATDADVIALGNLYGDDFSDSAVPAATMTLALAYAADMLDASSWGTKYTRGHASLTGHILKTAAGGSAGPSGAVTSRRVDKIQESYAVPGSASEAELSTTTYGQLHLRIKRTLVSTVSFGGTSDGWDIGKGRIL